MPKLKELRDSEIPQTAPQSEGHNQPHLKYFYTNAHSTGKRQNELEVLAQSQGYDVIGISETW